MSRHDDDDKGEITSFGFGGGDPTGAEFTFEDTDQTYAAVHFDKDNRTITWKTNCQCGTEFTFTTPSEKILTEEIPRQCEQHRPSP